MLSDNYKHYANESMLWDPQVWIGEQVHTRGLDVTNWGSMIAGIASALCVVSATDAIVNQKSLFLALISFWS